MPLSSGATSVTQRLQSGKRRGTLLRPALPPSEDSATSSPLMSAHDTPQMSHAVEPKPPSKKRPKPYGVLRHKRLSLEVHAHAKGVDYAKRNKERDQLLEVVQILREHREMPHYESLARTAVRREQHVSWGALVRSMDRMWCDAVRKKAHDEASAMRAQQYKPRPPRLWKQFEPLHPQEEVSPAEDEENEEDEDGIQQGTEMKTTPAAFTPWHHEEVGKRSGAMAEVSAPKTEPSTGTDKEQKKAPGKNTDRKVPPIPAPPPLHGPALGTRIHGSRSGSRASALFPKPEKVRQGSMGDSSMLGDSPLLLAPSPRYMVLNASVGSSCDSDNDNDEREAGLEDDSSFRAMGGTITYVDGEGIEHLLGKVGEAQEEEEEGDSREDAAKLGWSGLVPTPPGEEGPATKVTPPALPTHPAYSGVEPTVSISEASLRGKSDSSPKSISATQLPKHLTVDVGASVASSGSGGSGDESSRSKFNMSDLLTPRRVSDTQEPAERRLSDVAETIPNAKPGPQQADSKDDEEEPAAQVDSTEAHSNNPPLRSYSYSSSSGSSPSATPQRADAHSEITATPSLTPGTTQRRGSSLGSPNDSESSPVSYHSLSSRSSSRSTSPRSSSSSSRSPSPTRRSPSPPMDRRDQDDGETEEGTVAAPPLVSSTAAAGEAEGVDAVGTATCDETDPYGDNTFVNESDEDDNDDGPDITSGGGGPDPLTEAADMTHPSRSASPSEEKKEKSPPPPAAAVATEGEEGGGGGGRYDGDDFESASDGDDSGGDGAN